MTTIDSQADLRSHYHDAPEGVWRKQIDHIDDGARAFLAVTTLFVMASTGPDGADCSPRGGPPGFLRALDDRRVAFGDLSGNNRLDSYTNLTHDPQVGLLCIVPGIEETMRLNGTARLTTDAEVLAATALDERLPKVAVVIDVAECYIHCAKALRRSGIWEPDSWLPAEDRPSPSAIMVGHLDIDLDPEVLEAGLEASYQEMIWEHGGR